MANQSTSRRRDRRVSRIGQLLRLARSYVAFRTRRVNRVPPPFRLWIEPTNRCNLHCVMCPTGVADPSRETGLMDLDTYRTIIDEVAPFAFDLNLHHRGESLLHPGIVEMIEYAAAQGLYTNLHTNGTIMSDDLARRLVQSGLDILSFSFDAIDPEAYSKIRVGGKYEKVLGNIRKFLATRRDLESQDPHTTVEAIDFSSGSTPRGRQEKAETLARLFEDSPDAVRVKAPHNWAGEYPLTPESGTEYTYSPCMFLWYSLTILYDGSLVACPQDMSGSLKIGEAGDGEILRNWNRGSLLELRERMVKRNLEGVSPCDRCDRLMRRRVLGLPREELGRFLRENLFRS